MDCIVIGLTGPFGSGCTYIARRILEPAGYGVISLSSIIQRSPDLGSDLSVCSRGELQTAGERLRQEHGPDILAKHALEIMAKHPDVERWVVDGITSPCEAIFLSQKFRSFYLVSIYADAELRWRRVTRLYRGDRRTFELEELDEMEGADGYGPRVADCHAMADAVIVNEGNSLTSIVDTGLEWKTNRLASFFEHRQEFSPSALETLMATAYMQSKRSTCTSRKVGAVIADSGGNIISSGYNAVLDRNETCEQNGGCLRQVMWLQTEQLIEALIGEQASRSVSSMLRKRYRNLDYCPALHAEEKAILNIALHGNSIALRDATLYATTFPCNMCAKTIGHMGICRVVFMENYPMSIAHHMLKDIGVELTPFEGITHIGQGHLSC